MPSPGWAFELLGYWAVWVLMAVGLVLTICGIILDLVRPPAPPPPSDYYYADGTKHDYDAS